MIDTIKIISPISENIFEIMKKQVDIKSMYNIENKIVYYEIFSGSLVGSFDSRLSVRVTDGEKYKIDGYVCVIEGSYHKITQGHNAFNGYTNLQYIVTELINMVNNAYCIELPTIEYWYLQRVDITKVFDLGSRKNLQNYCNNLRFLSYPRRQPKFYGKTGVYFSGSSTTLKIYDKLTEFKKNDLKKFKKVDKYVFDTEKFMEKINNYLRFEVEIKKRKLLDMCRIKTENFDFNKNIDIISKDKVYNDCLVDVCSISYIDLEKVWFDEMEKVLKFDYNRLEKVRTKDQVLRRLKTVYNERLSSVLYSFYLSITIDGYTNVYDYTPESTFYRKIKQLKEAGIDFSQNYNIIIEDTNIIDFDPFNNECEVV